MDDDPVRSQAARAAAELALVRVVHHYGDRPEFVVLGGLVPQLLCSAAGVAHAGTSAYGGGQRLRTASELS